MRKKELPTGSNNEVFLRSINISLDAEHPERIQHYYPTKKSTSLLRALMGLETERCFMVIAPYGSGKSLAGAYSLHQIENRPVSRRALEEIENKLERVDPEFSSFSINRRESDSRGFVITLNGHCPDLAKALHTAAWDTAGRLKLRRQLRILNERSGLYLADIAETFKVLESRLHALGFDRILVIWDEFGRHLESLVAGGRGHELNDIQQIAEISSRSVEVSTTFALLLHQTLLHYSNGLPSSARAEWKKVEGRFRLFQFVDDSFEISKLIAQHISDRGPRPVIAGDAIQDNSNQIYEFGWFSECSREELSELLKQASPLEPATLYLLPRISARVAQNERTLFSFLHAADATAPITPAHLYDFFSGEMQSDVSAGGTHRRWLETESALSKVVDSEAETKILKTACLMGLGLGGERSAVSREELTLGVAGFSTSHEAVSKAIDSLIDRNLLLHRKNSNQVTVWHGTDLDLRGRLSDEKSRHQQTFELFAFLDRESPPPVWRPVEHNSKTGVRRFFSGKYVGLAELETYVTIDLAVNGLAPGIDGEVLYLICENMEEADRAKLFLTDASPDARVIVAVPSTTEDIHDAALEVFALQNMQQNPEIVQSDPLAVTELTQLIDDARSHLRRLIDRHTVPSPGGPEWWAKGHNQQIPNVKALRNFLSRLMDEYYAKSPRIISEAVVRHQPTRVMVNARKKLELAILERAGQERLGIEGNFPDASMYQTVLVHTGLYKQSEDGRWRFTQPTEIKDEGLSEVWSLVRNLLVEPISEPKDLRALFDCLQQPPFGVRRGLIPVLLAAGLRAFPAPRALTHKGEYVSDILPSVIEEICKNPKDFELVVLELDDRDLDYLHQIHSLFSESKPTGSEDLIRQCYDALQSWRYSLPESALKTRRLSRTASTFRRLIDRVDDPVDLFFHRLPNALAKQQAHGIKTVSALRNAIAELTEFSTKHREYAEQQLRQALALESAGVSAPLAEVCDDWLAALPDDIVTEMRGPAEKGLITCMRRRYDSPERLLDSIASHLTGQSISRWDDATAAAFAKKIRSTIRLIEDHAIAMTKTGAAVRDPDRLKNLYKRRLGAMVLDIRQALGDRAAEQIWCELNPETKKELT